MPYKRLFVPVDGSDLTDTAINATLELAQQLGAAIVGYVAEPGPLELEVQRHRVVVVADLERLA